MSIESITDRLNSLIPALKTTVAYRGAELQDAAKTLIPVLDSIEKDLDKCESIDAKLIQATKVSIQTIKLSFNRSVYNDLTGFILLGLITIFAVTVGRISGCFF
jgi:hypothetical protein